VYAEGELAAKERLSAVHIGDDEASVVSMLGPPEVVIMQAGKRLSLDLRAGERLTVDAHDRTAWPMELQFLPAREIGGKVLVYVEGTVFAYYFVDERGHVEFVDVSVS
jgi:hypothetical protein